LIKLLLKSEPFDNAIDEEAVEDQGSARVPIILTSRADSARTRLASAALAVLFAAELRRGAALLKAAE
jgi:hypothetical protein